MIMRVRKPGNEAVLRKILRTNPNREITLIFLNNFRRFFKFAPKVIGCCCRPPISVPSYIRREIGLSTAPRLLTFGTCFLLDWFIPGSDETSWEFLFLTHSGGDVTPSRIQYSIFSPRNNWVDEKSSDHLLICWKTTKAGARNVENPIIGRQLAKWKDLDHGWTDHGPGGGDHQKQNTRTQIMDELIMVQKRGDHQKQNTRTKNWRATRSMKAQCIHFKTGSHLSKSPKGQCIIVIPKHVIPKHIMHKLGMWQSSCLSSSFLQQGVPSVGVLHKFKNGAIKKRETTQNNCRAKYDNLCC